MFKHKKTKTLGQTLEAARTAKRLSVDEMCQGARIAKKYILALEQENYDELPGRPYGECFIKSYCQCLGLDEKEFIRLYNKKKRVKNIDGAIDINKPIRKISRFSLLVAPKIIRNVITAIILIICLTYLGGKIQAIVRPPALKIISPATDMITDKNTILITGDTEPETKVTINGQKVLVQSDGEFFKQLFLQPGVNTIKIIAKKKHSAERVELRRVVVEE